MAKLYPPSIEGKLPAFAGNALKVPLVMNRAVNMLEVGGMQAIVKTVQTGTLKATLRGALTYDSTTGKYYAIFELENFTPNLGQYYKIQIAYLDKTGECGYYSSIGVIKYTSYPLLTIPALTNNYYGGYSYTGVYSQEGMDGTEKVYSYCFELTDSNDKIISTSGVCLHNSSNDNIASNISQDTWQNKVELLENENYYLTYRVTTMNGLEVSSPKYLLIGQEGIEMDFPAAIIAEMNYDDGCVGIYLHPYSNRFDQTEVLIDGSFVLSRASSLDNFTTWNEIYRFQYGNTLFSTNKAILLWKDFTVQQGVEYKYSIQAYNLYDIYSNRVLNVNNVKEQKPIAISADFEDAFLYDGNRQLKIRFNPKISSFKTNILESKTETIGSKFPFIFRNGNVEYKEFQVSGLISLMSDPNECFMTGIQSSTTFMKRNETAALDNPPAEQDTALTSNNIFRERQFKMEVLNWLNNGKAKLFRSPTEGNYIVRLMNISLSPNDTLGRMLHTFQGTAYEVAEYNFDNLVKHNLIKLSEKSNLVMKIGQISPAEVIADPASYPDFQVQGNTICFPASYNVNITEATPGTTIGLNFGGEQSTLYIQIGGTGAYYVQIGEQPLISLTLISGSWNNAKVTFSYYDDTPAQSFSSIVKVVLSDEVRQFIGESDFYSADNLISKLTLNDEKNNYIDKRQIQTFHYLKIMKRQVQTVYYNKNNGNYYYNEDDSVPVEWNPLVIYYDIRNNRYFNGHKDFLMGIPDFRLAIDPKDANDYIYVGGRDNNSEGDQGDTSGRIDSLYDVGNIKELYIGSGVVIEMSYRVYTAEYAVESTDTKVAKAKSVWEAAQARVEDVINDSNATESDYIAAVKEAENAYSLFINELNIALRKG